MLGLRLRRQRVGVGAQVFVYISMSVFVSLWLPVCCTLKAVLSRCEKGPTHLALVLQPVDVAPGVLFLPLLFTL